MWFEVMDKGWFEYCTMTIIIAMKWRLSFIRHIISTSNEYLIILSDCNYFVIAGI